MIRKKLTKLYVSRFIIVFFAIIFQAAFLYLIYWYLDSKYNWVSYIIYGLGVIIFLSIVNKEQAAVYKMPWTILLLLFPVGGIIIYLTFGNVKMSKKHMRKFRSIYREENDNYYFQDKIMSEISLLSEKASGQAHYLKKESALPVLNNTETVFLPSGEKFFESLLEEIGKAEKYIFMEYFIVEEGKMWNSVHSLLLTKISEGVDVYFMYDDVGSMVRVPSNYYKILCKEGFKAVKYSPFKPVVSIIHNNRDHRKITVIDGKVGYMGGANLADEYINAIHPFGRWLDSSLMLKGQAVDSLVKLFIQLYNMASKENLDFGKFIVKNFEKHENCGYVLPFGDAPAPIIYEHIGENAYLNVINQSNKYIYISTPYFIVDSNMTDALKNAAKRGVDVRIILPEIPDKRIINIMTKSNYSNLIAGGVKIYEYKGGFNHSKVFLSDSEIAIVGTINLDYRSLVHHFECAVWMYKTPAVKDIYNECIRLFENDCKEISPAKARLKLIPRMVKDILYIFAPLM